MKQKYRNSTAKLSGNNAMNTQFNLEQGPFTWKAK